MKFKYTIPLFSILFISLLISCQKEENNEPPPFANLDCESIENILEALNKVNDDFEYVSNYDFSNGQLSLEISDNSMVQIDSGCVLKVKELKDKSQLVIYFDDSNSFAINYRNAVDLDFIYNPNGYTPLSGRVDVRSNKEVKLKLTIRSKYQNEEDYSFTFNGSVTDAQLPVLGLYYDHNNRIYFELSDGNEVYYRDTSSVFIGVRPNYLPTIIVSKNEPERTKAGMHFVSYRSAYPTTPFIIDNNGEFRYVLDFRNHPNLNNLNYDVGMERLKNGNYYFGNIGSSNVYEIDVLGNIINSWNFSPYIFHHNVQEKENGNLLVTVSAFDEHNSGFQAIEDWIIELDRNSGNVVNTWNLKESLNEDREIYGWAVYETVVDWAHVNAVIHDPRDNSIIVSCRTQGVVKLDENNNVKWILGPHLEWGENGRGEDLNQYLLTPLASSGAEIEDSDVLNGLEPHPDFEWPWYQHAPYLDQEGDLWIFDNGQDRNFRFGDQYSRAVEYKLNEDAMTIEQKWQYGKERGIECYSRIVSDVDFHNDVNTVYFCPGSRVQNGGGNFGGKIIEVDYTTGEVLTEILINAPDIVFHRAEKMTLYPHNY